MRLPHLLAAAVLSIGAVTAVAVPAQASTDKPVREPWVVSANHFGKYTLGESVTAAAKYNHMNYKKLLQRWLKDWSEHAPMMCPDNIEIPVITINSTNPVNATDSIRAVVQVPCARKPMSLGAYERKYHPYTTAKFVGYMAELYPGGLTKRISGEAAHKYLPHTSKIDLGDSYSKLMHAYKGEVKDYTSVGTIDSTPTIERSGYVTVFAKVGRTVIRSKPLYNFYVAGEVGHEQVIEMSIGKDLYTG